VGGDVRVIGGLGRNIEGKSDRKTKAKVHVHVYKFSEWMNMSRATDNTHTPQ